MRMKLLPWLAIKSASFLIRMWVRPWLAIENASMKCPTVPKQKHSEWEGQAAAAQIFMFYCNQSPLWRPAQRKCERQNSLTQIVRADLFIQCLIVYIISYIYIYIYIYYLYRIESHFLFVGDFHGFCQKDSCHYGPTVGLSTPRSPKELFPKILKSNLVTK